MYKKFHHRVALREIPSNQNIFRWHWPRGTFEPRMSAYEIAAFLLPHMGAIVGFLPKENRIQDEFSAMLVMLATRPREILDRIVPWIKPCIGQEPDDIIELHINAIQIEDAPRKIFI